MSQNGAGGLARIDRPLPSLGGPPACIADADAAVEAILMPYVEEFRSHFAELATALKELSGRVWTMNENASAARAEHLEMDRKLKVLNTVVHGPDEDSSKGMKERLVKVETQVADMRKVQAVVRSRTWDVFSGVFVAIAVLAIAHYFGLKP